MARRGENIYRRKDGRWEGRYMKGRKEDGKPRYGYVYGAGYGAVKSRLLRLKHRYLGVGPGYAGTFSDFARSWLAEAPPGSRKPSTVAFYATLLRVHLLPAFGARALPDITRADVEAFARALAGTGMRGNSARNVTGLLNRIMKAAAARGLLPFNPCAGVSFPGREAAPMPALRRPEQRRLEKEAAKDRDGAAVLLALYTGMRIGELCALRWEDVDLVAGVVCVRRTLQRIPAADGPNKTETVFGAPKSVYSRRSIPLTPSLRRLLKEAARGRAGEYVISRGRGFAEPRAVRYRFRRILEKAGLPLIRFHTLRHTFATRCMETGADVTTLSRLLGHSSVKMTLDIYTDSTPERKAAAINRIGRLNLSGTPA
jgi:integrase